MCPWAKIGNKRKAKRENLMHLLVRDFIYSHPLFGVVSWGTWWKAPAGPLARLTKNWRVEVITKNSSFVYEEGI